MGKVLLLMLLASSAFAQNARGIYTAEWSEALVATAQAVTIQIPAASGVRNARMDSAAIYCSVQCEFTVERDGAAATTTAMTSRRVSGNTTSVARAYRSSDAGTGTVLSRLVVPAGGTVAVDLSDIGLFAGQNCTVRTAAITGTAIVNVKWREF
jgi:hypothetical protein